MNAMHRIAVMTSGGDAPGLNACIFAVVRSALYQGKEVFGIRDGYDGLIDGDFIPMDIHMVEHIISRGGTMLKTSRSTRFKTPEGRLQAYRSLKSKGIGGLVIIGGDGSLQGASVFSAEYREIPVVGVPKTIDNDVSGTASCIGFDTALNTAVEAVDKLRDTASSHDRIFVIEVMGRDAGYIAYGAGLASGAEGILIPETTTDWEHLRSNMLEKWKGSRTSQMIIVAEGDEGGGAVHIAEKVRALLPERDVRVTILGHIQRGGSPTAIDRILAIRLGIAAVDALVEGKNRIMVGWQDGHVIHTPLAQVGKRKMRIDQQALRIMDIVTFFGGKE